MNKNTFEHIKGWLLVIGIIGLVGLGIWWLVRLNTVSDGSPGTGSGTADTKKGAITSGLIEGKDYGTDYSEHEEAEFEALVILRDQLADNPDEDQRSSLKRGDVLAVRKRPHLWSDTERKSYLVVPIKMTGTEANALLAPKMESGAIVLARALRIDLDKLGVTESQIASSQPLEKKVYTPDVIVRK